MEAPRAIEDVPWNRIADFYGRASDIGAAINELNSDHHEQAEKKLRERLEHQDGVVQATPIAVHFIIHMLASGNLRDREAVISMLRLFQSSADYYLSLCESPVDASDWECVLGVAYLLPIYSDDRTEAILWEEWDPGAEMDAWSKLTYDLIARALGENHPAPYSRGGSP